MTVTKEQAEMIATLTCAARPYKARRWDPPGVMAALANVRHLDLAEVMMAAGRAARDRDLETPAAIGNPAAPCWIERPIERPRPPRSKPGSLCQTCGHPRERCEAVRWDGDDHTFEPFTRASDGSAVEELRDIKAKALTMPADNDYQEDQ